MSNFLIYSGYDSSQSNMKDNTNNKPILIFQHLHRTGGSTLKVILKRYYHPKFQHKLNEYSNKYRDTTKRLESFSQEERDNIKLLHGHMNFGCHIYFSQPLEYITIIRHPVDRIMSEHNAIITHLSVESNHFRIPKKVSLRDFVDSDLDAVNDYQTRVLSGQWCRDSKPYEYTGALTEDDFIKAKTNLKKYFKVIGVTDRMDETILVMAKVFGWRNPYYFKKRRVRKKTSVDLTKCKAEIKEIIEQRNKFDLALYRLANKMLDEQIQKHYGKYFKVILLKYKILNRIGSVIIGLASALNRAWFRTLVKLGLK